MYMKADEKGSFGSDTKEKKRKELEEMKINQEKGVDCLEVSDTSVARIIFQIICIFLLVTRLLIH